MELARQGRGPTAPNPCVGAVLVHDGRIVAEGWHTRVGRLHAERECLADATEKGVLERISAADCTLYVTLEPCNHHGRTPPCTEAILEAGIGEVVVGFRDPNPVAAGGIERLESAGVRVHTGVLEQQCRDLVADFLLWQQTGRTYNILKLAATLDGKIAAADGCPEPVSCPESFEAVQGIRSFVDAVVVGGETFRNDNPSLTCRCAALPESFRQPLAVVVTSALPSPDADRKLVRERPQDLIFWTGEAQASSAEADDLRQRGVRVLGLPQGADGLLLEPGFEWLRRECGCHYTMVEGGGRLALSLTLQGLADEIDYFLAPRILGDATARSAFSGRNGIRIADAIDYRISRVAQSGNDIRLTLMPAS
ncbi:bifunctional diaminohydroxyphosphoribosylaminopyrimidine deaminase/5-amino-6-(5-phosphoribosylamino)uracil reductase RibD [Salidesulfovibrio brasiliensis]